MIEWAFGLLVGFVVGLAVENRCWMAEQIKRERQSSGRLDKSRYDDLSSRIEQLEYKAQLGKWEKKAAPPPLSYRPVPSPEKARPGVKADY